MNCNIGNIFNFRELKDDLIEVLSMEICHISEEDKKPNLSIQELIFGLEADIKSQICINLLKLNQSE